MLNNKLCQKIFFIVIACAALWVNPADAALTMNVSPVDGGNTLRFGQIDLPDNVAKEVDIRITSTDGKQYQVFQRAEGPMVNERGEFLDNTAILVSAMDNSNAFGSLYLNTPVPVDYGEELIYTSTPNGDGDMFTLYYQVDPDEVTKSGNFVGKILFILRPIGGGRQQEIVLNVYLEAGDNFSFDYRSSAGMDLLELSTERDVTREGFFEISFEGNRGREIEVYQEILHFPSNDINETLQYDAVDFLVQGVKAGKTYFPHWSNFERGKTLVYSSDSQNDKVTLYFKLDEEVLKAQEAGNFRGKIRYTIESEYMNKSVDLSLAVVISPIFDVTVELPEEGMGFGRLVPGMDPIDKEVVVTVNTNLGKPYAVNQKTVAAMANEEGDLFNEKHFLMKQELLDKQKGRIFYSDFKKVPSGDSTVFFSDKKGSSSKFRVWYRLNPYEKMEPGEYKTSIVYSLGEI